MGKADVKQKKSRMEAPGIHEEDFPISLFVGWDNLLSRGYWELTLQQRKIEGTLGETLDQEKDG